MTNDSASPRLYRVEQIAQDAGISRTTVNRLMRRGALERVKIGNATRIT
ncbi:helix-turn-helix domain-containing protein, partial [Gluconacetobacter aggeris]